VTQAARADTREYTPGLPASAQPAPHDTMPTWVHPSLSVTNNGPPLSPWHESIPPDAKSPAQSITDATKSEPYASEHPGFATIGIATSWSTDGYFGLPLVAPQPMTVTVVPAASSPPPGGSEMVGYGAELTNSSRATSLAVRRSS